MVIPTHRVVWWMVEVDVNIPRVRPGRIWPTVSLTTLLVAHLVAFFCRAWRYSSCLTTTRSRKTLLCKSSATHGISAPEEASANWWPSWYKGDKVIATMRRCEEKFIAEAVKIERWSWPVTYKPRFKVTWQDHVQLVIYRSCDHDITIAFPLKRELRQTCRYRYECNLVKNLPTYWEIGEENRETKENILAP